jgi:FkbM family methyltransferase
MPGAWCNLERMKLQIGDDILDFILRHGTSDSQIIGQIFVDLAFDVTRLRRWNDLQVYLDVNRAMGKRPLIIDAGANIGATAVYFAKQCPDALIIAIEPEPYNFQLLKENTRQLSVIPLACGLAATATRLRVVDPGEGEWGFRTVAVNDTDTTTGAVRSTTVNEIFDQYGNDCFPFIVKIDIEGAEKDVFAERTEWIGRTPLLIVEPHDWMLPKQGTAAPLLRALAPLDRDFVFIGENIFSISNALDELSAAVHRTVAMARLAPLPTSTPGTHP